MRKVDFLDGDKDCITIDLYREAFYEDSQQFVDYFYKYEAIDNKIALIKEDNKVLSMLHLHKFNIDYMGDIIDTYYIVAVATLKSYRKQGLYKKILLETFDKLFKEKIPFVFLMPAKEEIYAPFNFVKLVDINVCDIFPKNNDYTFEQVKYLDNEYIDFIEKNSGKFYIKRDKNYFNRVINCLDIESGSYVIAKKSDKINAILRYIKDISEDKIIILDIITNTSEKEIAENFAYEFGNKKLCLELNHMQDYHNKNERHIKYMYRIINVYEFIDILKSNKKLNLNVKIVDEYIHENNVILNIKTENNKFIYKDTNIYDVELNIDEFLLYMLNHSDMERIPYIHEIV